jgi:hypothetical protein
VATAGQFGQEAFDSREQAKSADLNRVGRLESRMLQEFARHILSADGKLGTVNAVLNGLHVAAAAGMNIFAAEGLGFIFTTANLPTDDSLYPYQPFGLDDLSGANSEFTLSNAVGGGNEHTYRVEIAPDTEAIELQTVQVLDVNGNLDTDTFPKRIVLRSQNGATLLATAGAIAPYGTSVPPAATAGFVTLAYVTVKDTHANATQFIYVDKRPMFTQSPRVMGAPWAMGRVRSDGTGAGNIATTDALNATVAVLGIGRYRVTFVTPPQDDRYYVRLQLYAKAGSAAGYPKYISVSPEVTIDSDPKTAAGFTVDAHDKVGDLTHFGSNAGVLDGFDFFVHLTPTP